MFLKTLILVGLAVLWLTPARAETTVERVRSAGTLRCGVVATPEDWNKDDLHGPLAPLAIEMCKAVSVAVLGVDAKLDVTPYSSELEAEEGLSKGEVDLDMGVTPQATAMWHWNIAFGPPIFYDAQAILVRADAEVASLADLGGLKVCYIEGTDNEKILLARTVARGIPMAPMPFQEEGEMDDGMAVRHCDAVSAYLSRLAALQRAYPKQLANDRLLPDRLALAPASPAYRQGDPQWALIVDWTIHSLVEAEASGITRENVAKQRASEDVVVQRLLGVDWATSRALGLSARDWAAQVISVVGNYGEIYERTVGMASALQMPRGLNALWRDGGLLHPLAMQ